jgi:hypothetical protein
VFLFLLENRVIILFNLNGKKSLSLFLSAPYHVKVAFTIFHCVQVEIENDLYHNFINFCRKRVFLFAQIDEGHNFVQLEWQEII